MPDALRVQANARIQPTGHLQIGQARQREPAGQVARRQQGRVVADQLHIQCLQAGIGREFRRAMRCQGRTVLPAESLQRPAG